jgi:hypothetical protein
MHLDPVSLECRHISLSYGSNEVLRDVNLKSCIIKLRDYIIRLRL